MQKRNHESHDDIFSHVVAAPPDPIFGITLAYKADTSDKKIDFGVGAYRTDDEKPYVFDIVRKVEKEIANDHSLNKGSIVLLHVCAHNPNWSRLLVDASKRMSVQSTLRKFAELGFQMIVAQSYSKNMGLYGERVEAVHIVTASKDASTRVLSQLKIVSRTLYSNPPTHGARIDIR